ncbi:MAG: hypothetical protein E6H47_11290 [Betaproteobacteria bacterium]|nr:MAG: hypothetical protein E6H47_11290 [Betaproteobacteria bacterium]
MGRNAYATTSAAGFRHVASTTNLAETTALKSRFVARCPLCGAQFECGAGEGECWCAALPGLAPIPGRDCLCRKCLEQELKKSSPQST